MEQIGNLSMDSTYLHDSSNGSQSRRTSYSRKVKKPINYGNLDDSSGKETKCKTPAKQRKTSLEKPKPKIKNQIGNLTISDTISNSKPVRRQNKNKKGISPIGNTVQSANKASKILTSKNNMLEKWIKQNNECAVDPNTIQISVNLTDDKTQKFLPEILNSNKKQHKENIPGNSLTGCAAAEQQIFNLSELQHRANEIRNLSFESTENAPEIQVGDDIDRLDTQELLSETLYSSEEQCNANSSEYSLIKSSTVASRGINIGDIIDLSSNNIQTLSTEDFTILNDVEPSSVEDSTNTSPDAVSQIIQSQITENIYAPKCTDSAFFQNTYIPEEDMARSWSLPFYDENAVDYYFENKDDNDSNYQVSTCTKSVSPSKNLTAELNKEQSELVDKEILMEIQEQNENEENNFEMEIQDMAMSPLKMDPNDESNETIGDDESTSNNDSSFYESINLFFESRNFFKSFIENFKMDENDIESMQVINEVKSKWLHKYKAHERMPDLPKRRVAHPDELMGILNAPKTGYKQKGGMDIQNLYANGSKQRKSKSDKKAYKKKGKNEPEPVGIDSNNAPFYNPQDIDDDELINVEVFLIPTMKHYKRSKLLIEAPVYALKQDIITKTVSKEMIEILVTLDTLEEANIMLQKHINEVLKLEEIND